MSWTTPTPRTTGELITASIWNTDIKDNLLALRTGSFALTSQVLGGVPYALTPTQWDLLYGTGHLRFDSGSAPSVVPDVLHASSGTSTNVSGHNLDSFSISGLTAKDTLRIYYSIEAETQTIPANLLFRNDTDAVSLAQGYIASTVLAAGVKYANEVTIRQMQSSALLIWAGVPTMNDSAGNTAPIQATFATFTTPWTGTWTLAFRANSGVTSGGTAHWSWAVYKLPGQ